MPIEDYADLYKAAGKQYGVDPELLMAQAKVESRGNPNAYNEDSTASGIAQLMPATAKALGVTDPNDPKQAIPAQAKLMAQNIKRYGDPETALMAYHGGTNQNNWGPLTKSYPAKVFANYKGTKVAQQEDDLSAALGARAGEEDNNAAPDDPLSQALSERAAEAAEAQPSSASQKQKTEPANSPKLLQELGKAGGDIASATGDLAWKGVQSLGSTMTPLKMAAIIPSMAIAPAASTLAEGTAAIPYAGAAARYIAGAAPEGAGFLTNLGYDATSGAAQGAVANKLMGGDASSGAAAGALLNPALATAGRVVEPFFNAITGYGEQVSPEVAKLAQTAASQYGIKIPGGLMASSPKVNTTYSLLNRLGLTPANASAENFASQVSKTFGENTSKLTRETMGNAEDRIGDMFNDVWKSTPGLDLGKTGSNSLASLGKVEDEARQLMPNDSRIPKQIQNILDIAANNSNVIPSDVAKHLVSTKSVLHKLTRDPDPNVADAAYDIKNALYDSLGENASPETLAKYAEAKRQFKNFKTVEMAKPDPVTGEISPTSLAGAVVRTGKKFGTKGVENLQTLGDIGQQFKLTPSSYTAENTILGRIGEMIGQQATHALGPVGSAVGGAYAGGPLGAVGAYTVGRGVGSYLSSDGYRNRLIQSALGNNNMLDLLQHTPALSNALISGARMTTTP